MDQHAQPGDEDDTHLAVIFCEYNSQKMTLSEKNTPTTDTEKISRDIKFDLFTLVSTKEICKIIIII